jgi:hypothetical protein
MKKLLILLSLGMVMSSGTAFAQSPEVTYDFPNELVEGDLIRSDTDWVIGRIRGVRTSLIQVRGHFVSEMLKSVESL